MYPTIKQGINKMVKSNFLSILVVIIIICTLFLISFYSARETEKNKYIVLGASLPLNGINKVLGLEVYEGANAYFSHINAKGGINGRKINFIVYDDEYEPQNTLINTNKLINKNQVFSLFGFVGTPTTKKILPIIIDKGIPFIAPYTGASFLRNPSFENIVNFRSSYKEEINEIIDYLYLDKNITRFAIFYQNDDFGQEGYIATIETLNKRGLKLVGEGTYKRNTLSIRHALHEIRSTNPEAIIIVGSYKPSAQFIKKARESGLENNITFAPISFVNANAIIKELNSNGKNIVFSQTVPPYDPVSLPIAKEYLKLLKFYYPESQPTYTSFESFLAAKVVIAALQNIKGKITREKFLTNLKNLPYNVLYNIPIQYKNTQLLNKVYLLRYKNNKFQLIRRVKP